MMSEAPALLAFTDLPRFSEITPEQVAGAVDSVLTDAERAVAAVSEEAAAPAWDNVIAPLEYAGEQISRVWNQVEYMHSVMSSPDWQQAHQENLAKIAAFYSRLGQNEAIYRRVCALADASVFSALPPVRQKIITDSRRSFELSGVNLPPEKKAQFRANSERLTALSAQFEERLLAATKNFSLFAEEKDLGDMPSDLRDIAAADARAHQAAGYRFTLQPPSYLAFMQYADNRVLRESLYRAYVTRASELGEAVCDNSPLVDEIVAKRQEQAALLGFANYAEVVLQNRMAASSAAVLDFLQQLVTRAKPFAEREMAALKQFAAEVLDIADLQSWDVAYASDKLRQQKFKFSDADLRPYLRQDKILHGLFDCIHRLFGVTLEEAADVSVWHEDVRLMQLKNSHGVLIGYVYLDLYARENKRSGAWMADALSRYWRAEGLQLPVAHITCNFSKPVGEVALLNWDEVVTLFHEFGHALHHLLTEVDEYSAAGISGVEWDAVELPSQWLENFVWEWDVLESMTAHRDSGEAMPKVLFDKALAARRFQSGLWLLRQLEFALFDMTLHDGKSLAAAGTPLQVLRDVQKNTCLLPPPDYNRFYCSFAHIFAGGYAAGYYSYLWAEVLAADMFMLFKESGLVLNKALGEQFCREILAVGSSRPAMESFVAVRGRGPVIAPLLAHYGLEESTAQNIAQNTTK